MGVVVQKYGGSSVADAAGIKRVAQRIVATKKAGHDVCVVVSAMGDTTDELLDLAEQVSPLPPGRELDMLLTAGERISMALLAMAIANLGQRRARSPAARPASSPTPRTAAPRSSTSRRAGSRTLWRPVTSRSSPASRASRRTPRTSPRSAAAGRTRRPSRSRRRSAPTSARSTPTSTASSPPTRGSSRRHAASRWSRTRRCSRWRLGRQDPAPALRRVRPPLRHADPRAVVVLAEDRHLGQRLP